MGSITPQVKVLGQGQPWRFSHSTQEMPLSFSYSAEQIRPAKSSLRWKTSAEIRWPSLSDTAVASDEALVSKALPKFALDAASGSATTVLLRGVFPTSNDMPGGAIPIGTAGYLLVRQHGEETLTPYSRPRFSRRRQQGFSMERFDDE